MKILLLIIMALTKTDDQSSDINYREIFGSNYSWAANWLNQHNGVIKKYALQFNVPEKELRAIIFPELIRYNKVFDAIQVESLKYLYVTEGKHYADFSVGYFQMKPSFAEQVEHDAVNLPEKEIIIRSGVMTWQKSPDTEEGRRSRLRRITNIDEQVIYLCAFYRVCLQKFKLHRFSSDTDRVRFLATCYNAGYTRSESSIMSFQLKKHYFNYNYSAVSAWYFEKE